MICKGRGVGEGGGDWGQESSNGGEWAEFKWKSKVKKEVRKCAYGGGCILMGRGGPGDV